MNQLICAKLKKTLKNAYNNSQYYRNILDENKIDLDSFDPITDFEKIPILTKDAIVENFDAILIAQYRRLKRNMLEMVHTSGSTGKMMEVLWDREDLTRSNLCLWRRRQKWYKITSTSKKCEFTTNTSLGKTRQFDIKEAVEIEDNILKLSTVFFGDKVLKNYWNAIESFNPEWIYTPVSVLITFIDFLKRLKIWNKIPSLRYIELFGEYVSEEAKAYIEDFFDVPVAVMYGCKEVNGIALTCPNGIMHILEDNVFVEADDKNILVTSLKNTVFPMIRYQLGDIVQISDHCCKCGANTKIIKKIFGREKELSYIDQRSGITSIAILNAIYVVNSRLDFPIIQYKITIEVHKFNIHLFIKDIFITWEKTIEDEFNMCFEKIGIDKCKIAIVFHNSPLLVNPLTGKLKLLETNVTFK